MTDLKDLIERSLALHAATVADNVTRNNAIGQWMTDHPPPPPSRKMKALARVRAIRERVGFWIAGHNPDQD